MSCPLICKEYESNFNIKNSWPVVGIGNQDVDTRFGIVCQMPDGRWVEKRNNVQMKKWILDHLPTIWVCAIYAFMIIIDHARGRLDYEETYYIQRRE